MKELLRTNTWRDYFDKNWLIRYLEHAPKGLLLYYISDEWKGTVYFDKIDFSEINENQYKTGYINDSIPDIFILVTKEPINDEVNEYTTIRIPNGVFLKHLYPNEHRLSWDKWQYWLFPKSVGSVIKGIDKHFLIINESEMIDEDNHVIFNMNIDTLPIFSYADINESKFKDADINELINNSRSDYLSDNNPVKNDDELIKDTLKSGIPHYYIPNTNDSDNTMENALNANNYILICKDIVKSVLLNYTENNNEAREFISKSLNEFLEKIKGWKLIEDFYVICDNTNNLMSRSLVTIDIAIKFINNSGFTLTLVKEKIQNYKHSKLTDELIIEKVKETYKVGEND